MKEKKMFIYNDPENVNIQYLPTNLIPEYHDGKQLMIGNDIFNLVKRVNVKFGCFGCDLNESNICWRVPQCRTHICKIFTPNHETLIEF